MRYMLIDTALGVFGIGWTDAEVARVALPGPDLAATLARVAAGGAEPGTPEGPLADLPDRIRRYAAGERIDFSDLPLDLEGVPEFHRRAYAELMKIGYGETTSYGAIARMLGDVALSRAVGQAMGQNRIPLIIPCHRVLGADGRPTGFSAPGGITSKMTMLALEGAASPKGQYAFAF
jgi:methylated-DNA-[protein]-cysteine S-methyltransferase